MADQFGEPFEFAKSAPLEPLTTGTGVSPTSDSWKQESMPELIVKRSRGVVDTSVGHQQDSNILRSTESNGYGSRARDESVPTSPVSQRRPSSVRRFFSRNSLSSQYVNDEQSHSSTSPGPWPSSPSVSTTSRPSMAKKRSSSWFRRFTGDGLTESESKRVSIVPGKQEEAMAPPPPRLPPLDQLKARVDVHDGGSFGGEDIFKSVR